MLGTVAESASANLTSLAAAYAAMLVIPGPSFAVVSQASLSATRREAGLVAMGVACGASLLLAVVLGGAARIASTQPTIAFGRLACTLLLLFLGFRALRRSLAPGAASRRPTSETGRFGHFAAGLVTALTNPISFTFFSSAALTVGARDDTSLAALLPAGVFVMALGWFGLIAILLSTPGIRTVFGRAERQLDAIMGTVLVTIAVASLTSF